jgi:hypothetical protein
MNENTITNITTARGWAARAGGVALGLLVIESARQTLIAGTFTRAAIAAMVTGAIVMLVTFVFVFAIRVPHTRDRKVRLAILMATGAGAFTLFVHSRGACMVMGLWELTALLAGTAALLSLARWIAVRVA